MNNYITLINIKIYIFLFEKFEEFLLRKQIKMNPKNDDPNSKNLNVSNLNVLVLTFLSMKQSIVYPVRAQSHSNKIRLYYPIHCLSYGIKNIYIKIHYYTYSV